MEVLLKSICKFLYFIHFLLRKRANLLHLPKTYVPMSIKNKEFYVSSIIYYLMSLNNNSDVISLYLICVYSISDLHSSWSGSLLRKEDFLQANIVTLALAQYVDRLCAGGWIMIALITATFDASSEETTPR